MSCEITPKIDQAKVDAFAKQMLGVLNSAALSLMINIGHKTRLFDTMAGMPPSTSEQIAQGSDLVERYVREWLGAMVTGRIVEYNAANGTYMLPLEHAALLIRKAGPNNLAATQQFISLMSHVQDSVVECFHNGGGVPYSAFPGFQQFLAEIGDPGVDANLVQRVLPLVQGLVERLQRGMDVADIGCGSGHAINVMAKEFPNSRFVGYDFSEEGITAAQAEATRLGLTNAHFEAKDVSLLDIIGQYDLITAFDTIHDQAKPAEVLKAIEKALRPPGTFLMVDIAGSSNLQENIGHPLAAFNYAISCNHCMTVSLALNGAGLGAMWGEQKARQMLTEAGFTHLEVKRIAGDILHNYYIASRGQ